MLLAIGNNRRFLGSAVTNLRPRCDRAVVAAESVSVALSLLEHNHVEAVVCEGELNGQPLQRSIHRRFPGVPCVAVALPPNWDAVVAEIERGLGSPTEEGCVVAYGTDEFLGLLAMTRGAADVEVSAGANYGSIGIQDGLILHATAGLDEGISAVMRILSWEGARVKSRTRGVAPVASPLNVPITTALHEAARRRDDMQRLASRADIGALIDRLADLPAFAGTLLADVDNRVVIVERGTAAQATRRRLWSAAALSEHGGEGLAVWDARGVVVAVPLSAGYALATVSSESDLLAAYRSVMTDTAEAIEEIIACVAAPKLAV